MNDIYLGRAKADMVVIIDNLNYIITHLPDHFEAAPEAMKEIQHFITQFKTSAEAIHAQLGRWKDDVNRGEPISSEIISHMLRRLREYIANFDVIILRVRGIADVHEKFKLPSTLITESATNILNAYAMLYENLDAAADYYGK